MVVVGEEEWVALVRENGRAFVGYVSQGVALCQLIGLISERSQLVIVAISKNMQ